jgi:hypothetical protein
MVAQFDRVHIPIWKNLGLSDYEIYWLIHEIPYNANKNIPDRHRNLNKEKDMIIDWIDRGLTSAEICRLLCVPNYGLSEQLRTWDGGEELLRKLQVSEVIRVAERNRL